MSHFNGFIEEYETIECITLSLVEEDDNTNHHSYNLVFDEFFKEQKNLQNWVNIQLTHWINTVGKNSSFKQIVRQFEIFCKQAEKLKV
jgi:hypothetical protein